MGYGNRIYLSNQQNIEKQKECKLINHDENKESFNHYLLQRGYQSLRCKCKIFITAVDQ